MALFLLCVPRQDEDARCRARDCAAAASDMASPKPQYTLLWQGKLGTKAAEMKALLEQDNALFSLSSRPICKRRDVVPPVDGLMVCE